MLSLLRSLSKASDPGAVLRESHPHLHRHFGPNLPHHRRQDPVPLVLAELGGELLLAERPQRRAALLRRDHILLGHFVEFLDQPGIRHRVLADDLQERVQIEAARLDGPRREDDRVEFLPDGRAALQEIPHGLVLGRHLALRRYEGLEDLHVLDQLCRVHVLEDRLEVLVGKRRPWCKIVPVRHGLLRGRLCGPTRGHRSRDWTFGRDALGASRVGVLSAAAEHDREARA
mmetsp:Transcript_74179/g.193527  ORF Transcript_74179/g.193527 Transcript_74179/m.193527 type:complete len:230 (+) Transcript_74179:195-884(+)